MSLTIGTPDKKVPGAEYVVIADVTFDSSYPAGGEAITAANFGLNTIRTILPAIAIDPDTVDNAVLIGFDATNSKLLAFWADYSNASDGVLIEVADTTSLAAYTAQLVVYGV